MFNNYEALRCDKCGKAFGGRKPPVGCVILCPDCMNEHTLPVTVLQPDEIPPQEVLNEVMSCRGEDDE